MRRFWALFAVLALMVSIVATATFVTIAESQIASDLVGVSVDKAIADPVNTTKAEVASIILDVASIASVVPEVTTPRSLVAVRTDNDKRTTPKESSANTTYRSPALRTVKYDHPEQPAVGARSSPTPTTGTNAGLYESPGLPGRTPGRLNARR